MKKILWIVLGLVALGFIGYYVAVRFYNTTGDINTKSEIAGLQLDKSADFAQFRKFLDERKFWEYGSTKSESGRERITPKKLTITITEVPQEGGTLSKNLGDQNYYSSYKFKTSKNHLELIVHINSDLCRLPECDIETSLNRQILKAIFQATNNDSTLNTPTNYQLLYQKYSKNYFNVTKKISLQVIDFVKNFEIISTVHAGCTWFCAAEHCDDNNNCTYGPDGFSESSTGSDCSTGCPSNYAVQNASCSGCSGATNAPPPPAECWNGAVNCAAGSTINLSNPINTFCSNNVFGQRMCTPLGNAQRETGCCRTVCAPDDPDDC